MISRKMLKTRIIIIALIFHKSNCQESFLLPLQKSGLTSSSEWAEYRGDIPHLAAFTSCHWEKLQYFNSKYHYVWNYCTIQTSEDKISCIQFSYSRDTLTAGRGVDVLISFGSGNNKHVRIETFNHRSWNNFCWSYESRSGENRVYLNGELVGIAFFVNRREAKGSKESYGHSFSIGQEPDAFRGGYDPRQAYRGHIAELNLWDYALREEEISEIGSCKKQARGNVVSWDKSNFLLYNVTSELVPDIKSFCVPEENLFVFPQLQPLHAAHSLCQAHGGYLYTPRDQETNQEMLAMLGPYKDQCQDKTGVIAWLGAHTRNSAILVADDTVVNYSNWKYPLFSKDNRCTYLDSSGAWLAHLTCTGMKYCPVCAVMGTPVITLKGKHHQ